MTRQELEGNWNQVKGRLREKWGQLKDDDLDRAYGDAEQLVGVIQEKTGRARTEIESLLEDILSESAEQVESVAASAQRYAQKATHRVREAGQQAGEQMQEAYMQAGDSLRDGYEQAEQTIRQRPMESIAVTFGVGLIAGVIMGLTMGRR